MTTYLEDTRLTPVGEGRYTVHISRNWWIVAGPNGGYIGAICARALLEECGPGRRLGSLTLHYLRPPAEGPAEVVVTVVRAGRTVTSARVEMFQAGRPVVVGSGSLVAPRSAPEFDDAPLLEVAGPDSVPASHLADGEERPDGAPIIPMRGQYDYRPVLSGPITMDAAPAAAIAGGWLRLASPVPTDEAVLVAYTDAWWPPVFHRLPGHPMAVPTVDLTVHIHRVPEGDHAWVFGRYESPIATGGYLVENASLFDEAGRLLAEARQLAVLA